MKNNAEFQEKSSFPFDEKLCCRRVTDANCRYASRITSITATNAPKLKITMRMIFSFRDSLILISIENEINKRAKSMTILTGADDR